MRPRGITTVMDRGRAAQTGRLGDLIRYPVARTLRVGKLEDEARFAARMSSPAAGIVAFKPTMFYLLETDRGLVRIGRTELTDPSKLGWTLRHGIGPEIRVLHIVAWHAEIVDAIEHSAIDVARGPFYPDTRGGARTGPGQGQRRSGHNRT